MALETRNQKDPISLIETSLWQAWAWVAWIERGLQILGIQNLRRKIIRIHHWFTTQTSTLTMFELDGDSGLNNSPLLTLWSLHELNVCNSIAAEQTLPVRFVRPIFHGHSHCAHAFVSFVWYSARFSDTINSGLLPEWKEIGFTLCPVDCKATAWEYVSQCVAMRTSQSIDRVDSSNCENSGASSTQNAMSMCKSFSRHKCLSTSWTPA